MEEMISSLILYSLMLLAVVLSVERGRKSLLEKLEIKKTNLGKELKTAVVFLGILIAVSILIQMVMVSLNFGEDLGQVTEVLKGADLGSLLVILTVASFVEEIFFRGYLQRKTNLLFASFIFAYFHIIYGSVSEIIGAFFLGIVLGKEYEKTKNLFAPIMSHFFYNLLTIVLMFA